MDGFGIERIAYFQPETKGNIFEWAEIHGYSPEFAEQCKDRNYIEEYFVSETTVEELALSAVERLELSKEDRKEIEYVIYFHTLQSSIRLDGASIPANIAAKFGLMQAKCFSIAQQNCVSPMMIFDILHSLQKREKFSSKALLVGADVVLDEGMRLIDGMQMESDGAAAILVDVNCTSTRIIDVEIATRGAYYAGMDVLTSGEATSTIADRLGYFLLFRLGKKVQKRNSVAKLDFIVPHNVNPIGLNKVANILGVDDNNIFFGNVPKNGHHYGCDNIINHSDCVSSKKIREGDIILWIAVGMGRTYGVSLIKV